MYIPKGKTTQTEDTNMTINEAMRTYRLPNPTTPEDLECRWSKLLTFGEFLDDDHTCEGTIGLRAASEVEFEDDGHAIAWAMQQ